MPDLVQVFSDQQLSDLTALLGETVVPGNILNLATSLLDPATAGEMKKHFDKDDFVRRVVDALHQAGRIADAFEALSHGTNANGRLAYGLNEIMQNRPLDPGALQSYVNKYEPFFSSDVFRKKFPRIMRTICAIGLGTPIDKVAGTGFLVGPDLVMTNYHVIKEFLQLVDGEVRENGDGRQLFCFFDYFGEPGPSFPLSNGAHPYVKVTALQQNWLVKGRPPLLKDGEQEFEPKDAKGKYDYAVIRLEKKIGNLPPGRGGGGARGWLTLTDDVDTMTPNRRVVVYQHPEQRPQQFDIGDFEQLDKSETRVRYSVSTTKGSSGGAAVDKDGMLFALHVAEVKNSPLGKVNQGVRIDFIAQDLQGTPGWNPQPPPDEQPMSFWSLKDDLMDPQPIIGRGNFRDRVYEMSTQPKPRVMVVYGPAGSGVRYSVQLLERVVGAKTPVIPFTAQDLSMKPPREFIRSLLAALGIKGLTVPTPDPTENLPRAWRDLARWLADRLAEDEQKKRVVYPAWVVLNTVVAPGQRFEWAEHLDEFIAAVAGARELDVEAVEVPQLRLLILTSASATLSLPEVERCDDDLATEANYADDYLQCLERALHALDKDDEFGAREYFRKVANKRMRDNPATPKRQVLSDLVREQFFDASGP